jgi:hypothetical protein
VEAGLAQVATIQAMPAMKERQHTVTLTWCASCNTVCTLYTYMVRAAAHGSMHGVAHGGQGEGQHMGPYTDRCGTPHNAIRKKQMG